jgi:hypothetical protein
MAARAARHRSLIREVADVTGRSETEVRLLVGGAVAVAALGVTLRAAQALVDLGASFTRHVRGTH